MFKIEYKMYENCFGSTDYCDFYPNIEDFFEAVETVYGDIMITVNNSRYGGISDIPFKSDREDICGDTDLDVWFCELLNACIALYGNADYKIKDAECCDEFLCFDKNENDIAAVSYLSGGKVNWTETIGCKELADEVIRVSESFIDYLLGYSDMIKYSYVVSEIEKRLTELKKISSRGAGTTVIKTD